MNRTIKAISTQVVLDVLADQRRRQVLRYLAKNGEDPISVDQLVVGLTGFESHTKGRQVSGDDAEVIELYHVHLPKLHDAGIIDFDRDAKTVRYRSHECVEDVLASVGEGIE